MREKVIFIGAGGHARSVLDIAIENDEFDIVGCLDPIYPERIAVESMEDIPIIGTDDDLESFYDRGIRHIFIAIGPNKLRSNLYKKAVDIGFIPVNIISQNARISKGATLGQGICIMAGAVLNVNSIIGDNCIINSNCSIDHDCNIGNSVHIAPGATLSGYVLIGDGTHIGTGANVIDRISIGKHCFVGCGSAVVSNIEDYVMAYGVPARRIKEIEKGL